MILVTGGAGFIGSNLVAALTQGAGAPEVAVADRLGHDEKWRNLAKHPVAEWIEPEHILTFLGDRPKDIEQIFHLGAISATTERDVDLIMRNNFTLSLALWNWCAKHTVPFIYASSAATYGDGAAGFRDGLNKDELAKLRPLNPYGWSKHLFDRRIQAIVANKGPKPPHWAGLKFFNVYGPNEYHKGAQASVVHQIYRQIERGEPATLFRSHREGIEDGEQRRDFVWVEDCVGIMLWLAGSKDVSGLFNVGTGKARSFLDLARATFAALNREPEIDYVDIPHEIRDRYQYFTEAYMGSLYRPGQPLPQPTSLEEGVRRYVQDFLIQDDPYR